MRGALGGGVVDVSIGPLAQGGLDEAFGLAVGAGREGARVSMAEASREAACVEGTGAVAPAVVGLEFRIRSLNRGLGHHCVAPVGGEFVGIRHRSIFGSREPGVPRDVVAMA